MQAFIELNQVKKQYQEKIAFQTEHLAIEQKQVCAIVGKNGSGKSTLLKLISGLLYPEAGRVTVAGVTTTAKDIKEKAKFVLESGRGYYDYLTARQNLDYFLQLNHTSSKKQAEELAALTDQFDFSEHWDKKVSDLSQGNRQKLSLIVTLLLHPQVLCLDEPTNGLDIQSKDRLIACLKGFVEKEKMTILFTTHDLYFTEKMADRLFLIHEGQVALDADPGHLLAQADKVAYQLILSQAAYAKNKDQIKGEVTVQDTRVYVTTKSEAEKDWLLKTGEVLEFETKLMTMEEVLNEVLTHVG